MCRFLLLSWMLCSLACPFRIGAQADSLMILAQTSADGLVKIDAYKDLAFANYNQDSDLALRYCDTLELVATRAGLRRQTFKAEYLRAVVWWTRGENDQAIEHCQRCMDLLGEPRNESERYNVSTLKNLLGSIYTNQGLYEEGANELMAAAELSLINRDSQGYAYSLVNVGSALGKHGDYASAREHTLRAVEVLKALGEEFNLVTTYNNLASYTDDLAEGMAYLEQAEYYGIASENHFQLAHTYHNYVTPLTKMARFPEALAYQRRAYQQAREYDNVQLKIGTAIGMSQLMDTLGQRDSAMHFLAEGIAQAEATGMTALLHNGYQYMAELFKDREQLDSAYFYLVRQLNLQDSLHQVNITESMSANNARFGVVERDRQIAEQELELARQEGKRNRILFGGLALLLLLGAVAYGLFQRQQQRKVIVELALATEAQESTRLRELDTMKTQFFTNVSHELRTPLTLITSPLEEALGKLKQTNLKPDLELAHRNSGNLLTLVNEILDLSKLEVGQLEKTVTAFVPEILLRRIFYAFESLADLQGVNLIFDGSSISEEHLTTDIGKLEKIVNNLVSNALKFSPKNSEVRCSVRRKGTELIVAVADYGPGIIPEDRERIFDRYFQSATNANHQAGTGIGLNLARKLARFLGGDLTVESVVGEGSVFTLRLPVEVSTEVAMAEQLTGHVGSAVEETSSGESITPPVMPWQPTFGRARILLVEDNVDMAEYLRRHLTPNYELTVVGNGQAALDALGQGDFDLISSDVMMPVMGGFELRERINANPAWRRIPFILLTARSLEEDLLRGFRLGIDDYITKPFSLPAYQARLNNLLENKAVRQAAVVDPVSQEDELVVRAEALVSERLADTTFTVEEMAKELGHGQRQLARLLSAATGLTPVRFILELRLQKARKLLEQRAFSSVAEVRYEIGIESASYFTRKFTERFGRNPREFWG